MEESPNQSILVGARSGSWVAVSVIIVNFNAGPGLKEVVDSALQAESAAEVIVVDNASTDTSIEEIEARWGGADSVRIIRNPQNLGFSTANNIALRMIESPFALLLNPDCVPQPGAIDALVRFMSSHTRAGVVGGLVLNPDGSEQKGCRRELPTPLSALGELPMLRRWIRGFNKTGEPLPTGPIVVPAVSGAFLMVRMSAIEAAGWMDEGYFLHFEDLELCAAIAEQGYETWFHPEAVAVHQKGVSSGSRPLFVHWHKHLSMWRFFRKRVPPHRLLMRVLAGSIAGGRFLLLLPGVLWRSFGARS